MTDEEIIARYRDKADKHWVGMLYERYAHLVLGLCYKYLQDKEKAEDMSVEIFISLFDKLLKHEVKQFRPWLYTLGRNHCLMHLRKKDSHATTQLNGHEVDDSLSSFEVKLLQEERLSLLEAAIDTLNDEQAACINYFYLKKLSYAEVGEKTGFTLKQVKSHLQNGKRNLRTHLEKQEAFNGNR